MKDLDQLIEGAVSSRKQKKGTSLDLNMLLEMVSEVVLEGKEKGKQFEIVVVQVVRSKSGTDPLTGGVYDGWQKKSEEKSGGKTLGEMANELYDTAVASGFFKESDFQNAKMQDIGKQQYGGIGPKIEIKTDVMFGDKPISIKMPGDTQADSSKISAIISKVQSLAVGEEFEEDYKEIFSEKKDKIIKASKDRYLTPGRIKSLVKKMDNPDPEKAEEAQKAQEILNSLRTLSIIDETYQIIKKDLVFNKDKKEEIEKEIKDYLENALRGNFGKLIKELLTGAKGFKDVPGAAARYLLSPEYAFDLEDEDTLEMLAGAVKMRVALKGDRKLNIEEIDTIKKTLGSEITLRWDIKKKELLEALKAKKKVELEKIEAAKRASGIVSEEKIEQVEEKSYEEIYDDIQDILLPIVEK